MKYPKHPEVAVGAIVFKDGRVLLVKRSKPPSEGRWAIPGGGVNLGETLREAARREIMEETGVSIRAGDPVFTFDVVEKDDSGRIRFHYVIVDLAAEYVSGDPVPADDATDAAWVSPDELGGLDVSPPTRRLLKDLYAFG